MNNKTTLTIILTLFVAMALGCQFQCGSTPNSNSTNTNSANANSNTAQKTKTETTPASVSEPAPIVKEFYLLYLKELVANKALSPETMKRYLTERMLKEIKDTTDADVITQGQDYDDTWANNVNTKGTEKVSDTKSVVTVELKGKDFSKTLKVTAVAQDNTWKIDSVKDTNVVENKGDSAESSNTKVTVVKFAGGKSDKDYEDTISPDETHIYVVNIRKGQYFGAQSYSDDYGVPFTVRRKGGEELDVPAESVKWGGEAPDSGDYEIVLGGVKKKTKYSISISAE